VRERERERERGKEIFREREREGDFQREILRERGQRVVRVARGDVGGWSCERERERERERELRESLEMMRERDIKMDSFLSGSYPL
jgi:hypothetical protein